MIDSIVEKMKADATPRERKTIEIMEYAYEHYEIDFPYSLRDIPSDIVAECKRALNIDQPRRLESKDVVRIVSGQLTGKTGVINRIDGEQVNIFLKGASFGVWFRIRDLKRIGRIK